MTRLMLLEDEIFDNILFNNKRFFNNKELKQYYSNDKIVKDDKIILLNDGEIINILMLTNQRFKIHSVDLSLTGSKIIRYKEVQNMKRLVIDSHLYYLITLNSTTTIPVSQIIESSRLKKGDKVKLINHLNEDDNMIIYIKEIEEEFIHFEQ